MAVTKGRPRVSHAENQGCSWPKPQPQGWAKTLCALAFCSRSLYAWVLRHSGFRRSVSPARVDALLSPACIPGAGKHARSCANGPRRQTAEKAPLHRREMQDEGSQQAKTAQKLSTHTTSYDEAPARSGARDPSRFSKDALQQRL